MESFTRNYQFSKSFINKLSKINYSMFKSCNFPLKIKKNELLINTSYTYLNHSIHYNSKVSNAILFNYSTFSPSISIEQKINTDIKPETNIKNKNKKKLSSQDTINSDQTKKYKNRNKIISNQNPNGTKTATTQSVQEIPISSQIQESSFQTQISNKSRSIISNRATKAKKSNTATSFGSISNINNTQTQIINQSLSENDSINLNESRVLSKSARDSLLQLNDYYYTFKGKNASQNFSTKIKFDQDRWHLVLDYFKKQSEGFQYSKDKTWNDHNVPIYSIGNNEMFCTKEMYDKLKDLSRKGYNFSLLQLTKEIRDHFLSNQSYNTTNFDINESMDTSYIIKEDLIKNNHFIEFEAYKHFSIQDFERIASGLFEDVGFENARDFVLSLPQLHDTFKDKRELASLIYTVFFNFLHGRSKYIIENENLTLIRCFVSFKPYLKYHRDQNVIDKIYETVLSIWARIHREQYLLGKLNDAQSFNESSSSSFQTEYSGSADFITERFLYLYLNDNRKPSLNALNTLIQTYIDCRQLNKLIALIDWMKSEDFNDDLINNLQKKVQAMEGKSEGNLDDLENQSLYLISKLKQGHLNSILTHFICYYKMSENLYNAINIYLQDPYINIDMNIINELKLVFENINQTNLTNNESSLKNNLFKSNSQEILNNSNILPLKNQLQHQDLKKIYLTENHFSLLLEFMNHVTDMDLAIAFEKEISLIYKSRNPPSNVETLASTIILQHYIQQYDIQGGERYFRVTFNTPLKLDENAKVHPSSLTYEWIKRGASLTSKTKLIEVIDKAQRSIKHII